MTHHLTLAINDDVTEQFPECAVHLVAVQGLRNTESWPEVDTALQDLERTAAAGQLPALSEDDPRLASWQRTYRAFGTNPRRQRPSVDVLRRRLAKNARLPRINGAVDAYNLVSARHGLPAGAFDTDTIAGTVRLRASTGGEVFHPLGTPDQPEHTTPNEIVYADDNRILTRQWNHHDAHPTRVQPTTTRAVFLLERADNTVDHTTLAAAIDDLVALLTAHTAAVSTHHLDATTRSITWALEGLTTSTTAVPS